MSLIQHPVPERFLIPIGNITVSFALLERCIQQLVDFAIPARQELSQIITAELSFAQLRALAFSLFLNQFGEDENVDIQGLKRLMARAESVEKKRNQITHSMWLAGKTADEITRMKTTAKQKDGLRFHVASLTVPDLEAVATEILEVATAVQDFSIRLMCS